MAIKNICAKLINNLDSSCTAPSRKYWQQAVLINKADIDTFTLNLPDFTEGAETCDYNVEFTLKCETSGVRISGIETGESFKGWYSKSRDDNGYPTYIHQVQVFISGTTEEVKCALDAMDKGSYIIAMQTKDGKVEIFGWENGLSTGDYDYDIQANGGGSLVVLQSLENSPENYVPLIYKSAAPGDEITDFDDSFAGVTPCA